MATLEAKSKLVNTVPAARKLAKKLKEQRREISRVATALRHMGNIKDPRSMAALTEVC